MYPLLLRPRDQQKYSALVTTSVKKEPQSMEVEQIETITPADSPAPTELKESLVEMQVETEDTERIPNR